MVILPVVFILAALGFALGGRYGSRLARTPRPTAGLEEKIRRQRRILLLLSSYACYTAAVVLLIAGLAFAAVLLFEHPHLRDR